MKKEDGMNVNLRKYFGTSVLSVALLLAAGVPALAANSRKVALLHDVVVNGVTLRAGQYTIRWQTHSPEATIQFVRHNEVIAGTEGRIEVRKGAYQCNVRFNALSQLETCANGYNRDAVVYNTAPDGTMSLVEIRFAYSNKVLVFNQ
jgi:hypothetical protein